MKERGELTAVCTDIKEIDGRLYRKLIHSGIECWIPLKHYYSMLTGFFAMERQLRDD